MKRVLPFAIATALVATAGVGLILQETTGTASSAPASFSEQLTVCGLPREPDELAILGRTNPPSRRGTVRIPELDLVSELSFFGCFEFRNLTLPQDPMLVSFDFQVEGFRPATWANYLVLSATGWGPNFTPRLQRGDKPLLIDPCPGYLSTPRDELSKVGQRHAQLCAQLAGAGALPETGGGLPVEGSRSLVASHLLALVGAALLCVGVATRRLLGSDLPT